MKKEQAGGRPSLANILGKELTKSRPTFSSKRLRGFAQKFADKTKIKDVDDADLFEAFFALYNLVFAPKHRSFGTFHPSQLRNGCERKMWYEIKGVEPTEPFAGKVNSQVQLIFDVGTWYHIYIQFLLFQSGVLKTSELEVKNEEMLIDGRADGLIEVDGVEYILEIKTINSFGFKKLTTKPKDDHHYQATIYAKNSKVDKIWFVYINKDTCEIKEFVVDADDKLWAEAKTTIKEVMSSKTAPERICADKLTDTARNCIYCSHCFKK